MSMSHLDLVYIFIGLCFQTVLHPVGPNCSLYCGCPKCLLQLAKLERKVHTCVPSFGNPWNHVTVWHLPSNASDSAREHSKGKQPHRHAKIHISESDPFDASIIPRAIIFIILDHKVILRWPGAKWLRSRVRFISHFGRILRDMTAPHIHRSYLVILFYMYIVVFFTRD